MSPEASARRVMRAGWVKPNAKCPVCGGGVYFYASFDGGRVYFDELGPPWPKHLCTDQSHADPLIKRHGVGNTSWPLNGWQPLHNFQVSLIASGSLYRISGRSGDQGMTITYRLDRLVVIEIARFRKRYDDVVELSLLARDRHAHQWLICEGEAKIAPSYPPDGMLAVLECISDAPDFKPESADVLTGEDVQIAESAPASACEPFGSHEMSLALSSHTNLNRRLNTSNTSPVPSSTIDDWKHPLRGSWVRPNSSCPVCGCAVYFYQSPYGGSVYFDELGPLWPKHACIGHDDLNSVVKKVAAPRWDKSGWQPLVNFQVELVGSGLYKIKGDAHPYDRTLLFRTTASTEVEIVRFKEGRGVAVELSMLVRDSTAKEWLICEGIAKIAPNYPPMEELVVVQRIPYADNEAPAVSRTGAATPEPPRLPVESNPAVPAQLAEASTIPLFPFGRVAEIDERIRTLLDEIARLNEEKTRCIHTFLKPAADNLR